MEESLDHGSEKKKIPCSGLRKELKDCIMTSDCVLKVLINSPSYSWVCKIIVLLFFFIFYFLFSVTILFET